MPFFSFFFVSSDHNVQQQYLENGSSTHRHFITKLMLITARSYRTTCSVFIALNSPWSIELSTALPSCCPLRRTPFSNVVRMRTCSLVPKPRSKTSGHVKSWVDQRRAYGSYMAGTVSSRSSDQGLCRAHHLGKLLTRSFSKARVVSCLNMVVCCPTRERKSGNQLHKGRYGEWLALRQVIAGNFMLHYLYMLGTTSTLSMLFQVRLWSLVHLKELNLRLCGLLLRMYTMNNHTTRCESVTAGLTKHCIQVV